MNGDNAPVGAPAPINTEAVSDELVLEVAKAIDAEAFREDYPVLGALHYKTRQNIAKEKAVGVIAVLSRRAANSAGGVEVKGRSIASAPRDGTYILARQEGVLAPSFFVVAFDQSWSDGGWWMTCDGKDPELPLRGPEPVEWWPLPGSSPAVEAEPVAPVRYFIEHDGFVGTVIGRYTRLDGKKGVVMQQDGTNIVHVYGTKWLKPAGPPHRSSPVSAEVTERIQAILNHPSASPTHDLHAIRAALAALNGGRENG